MNTLCKLFLMCVLFLFGIKAHGQTTNELNRMINESLLAYIHKWQVYVDQGIASPTVLENVCLQTDHYPPYFKFDQRILDMNPEQFSMANLQYNKAWRKKQKKGIGFFTLQRLAVSHDTIQITFDSRGIRYKRKPLSKNRHHFYIGSFGGENAASFFYKYSCEQQKWVLIESK